MGDARASVLTGEKSDANSVQLLLTSGVPSGVSYALVGFAVIVVLLQGWGMIKALISLIGSIGKPKPKNVTVSSIMKDE
jgi:hypothetical protein